MLERGLVIFGLKGRSKWLEVVAEAGVKKVLEVMTAKGLVSRAERGVEAKTAKGRADEGGRLDLSGLWRFTRFGGRPVLVFVSFREDERDS